MDKELHPVRFTKEEVNCIKGAIHEHAAEHWKDILSTIEKVEANNKTGFVMAKGKLAPEIEKSNPLEWQLYLLKKELKATEYDRDCHHRGHHDINALYTAVYKLIDTVRELNSSFRIAQAKIVRFI